MFPKKGPFQKERIVFPTTIFHTPENSHGTQPKIDALSLYVFSFPRGLLQVPFMLVFRWHTVDKNQLLHHLGCIKKKHINNGINYCWWLKSQTTTWDVFKNLVNNGEKLPTSTGDAAGLNRHQRGHQFSTSTFEVTSPSVANGWSEHRRAWMTGSLVW